MLILFLYISILIFIFLIYDFCLWPFNKSFVCFQFSSSIRICHILFLPIQSLFFSLAFLFNFYWFSILSFNQSLWCIIFFNLAIILLIFFLFVKIVFPFNLTLQSKKFGCPLIHFLFWFSLSFFYLSIKVYGVLFFSIWPSFSFLFVKVVFPFNLTL